MSTTDLPSDVPPELPPGTPELRAIAEAIHHAGIGRTAAHLVRVRCDHESQEVELGLHALSPALPHPLDSLVGFRAPEAWDAVGVTTTGRVHHLDRATPPEAVAVTSIVDRWGRSATVLDERDAPPGATAPTVIEDPPAGWSHDVLLRVLGRPTPPPEGSTAMLMDLWWLDALASEALGRPGSVRSWSALARRHPLCPPGRRVPGPEELATRTLHEALARPWWLLRERTGAAVLPAAKHAPRGEGEVLTSGRWFDDGALSRWVLRDLPPAEPLLSDLLDALPDRLGRSLLAGLAEVGSETGAATSDADAAG